MILASARGKMLKTLNAVGLALALVACSSSGGGGGGGGKGSNAAADECNALVAKLCTKLGPCANVSEATCVTQVNDQFAAQFNGDRCPQADEVGASYGTCMSDLDTWQCVPGAPSPPSTCTGVILFQQ